MVAATDFLAIRTIVDLLSEVLQDLRLSSTVFCTLELHEPWAFLKAPLEAAPFHIIIEGRCTLEREGAEPVELGAGDLVILPHGDEHALASGLGIERTPFGQLLKHGGVTHSWTPQLQIGRPPEIRFGTPGGAVTRMVAGVFAFRDQRRNSVLEGFQSVIHLRGEHGRGQAWLERSLRLLLDEAFSDEPGSSTVAERVADIMFVQAVRAFLSSNPSSAGGWLRGLTDPRVAKALARVHSAPAVPLTLEGLAREVGMSRTVFAQRFRTLVGESVMAYVARRRMHVAAGLLGSTDLSLAEVAARVGYDSDVALSKAFKRWSGEAPGRYRRRGRAAR
jgi:AraC-like DNA-binding protein